MAERAITDDVVAAVRRGDGAAFRTVYDELAPAVLGYLRAKGVADPEGVTHDVFLGVLPRLSGLTGGAAGLRKLVFSVAHARMVDEHRARSRRPGELPYDPDADARAVGSAEDAASETLATRRVLDVLDRLPDDQREVLTLRVVADLSIDQIAEIMGRSSGAVKQLQRRGLIAVREVLAVTPGEREVTL